MGLKEHEQTAAPGTSDFLNDWALRHEVTAEDVKPGAWRVPALVAAIAGIVFVVLYTVSYYLLTRTPLGSAPDAEIIEYYAESQNRTIILAGMITVPFAGIGFLYFMEALRATARASGLRFSRVLASANLATGIIFVALLFVASAGLVAMPAAIRFAGMETDPVIARMLPLFSTTVLLMFAMRMAAMFVFTASSIGRATGLLPSWFAWLGYVVGVLLLLTASFADWFALVFPAWVLALCVMLLWRRSKEA